MPQHELTRYAIGQYPRLPISGEEYEAIKAAKGQILEALAVEEQFDLVIGNFVEFEQELLTGTLHLAVYGTDGGWSASIGVMQQFARRLVNLLTTTKAYLDQLPHAINAMRLSWPHREAMRFFASEQYDSVLGYRVCEALRNYTQHRGSPIHALSGGTEWQDRPGGGRVRVHSMTPTLSVSALKEDEQFKRDVRIELGAIGDSHDVKPYVRDYVAALGRVHVRLRALLRPYLETWDRVLEDAIRRFVDAPGSGGNSIGLAIVAFGETGDTPIEVVQVFDKPIARRRWLVRRNGNPIHFASMVITSETASKDQ